jgi:hypothetical protein
VPSTWRRLKIGELSDPNPSRYSCPSSPSMRMPFTFPLQGPELSSDDRRGRNAALLELDAVVDTARRAGSSVGDPVDHHLALASRRLEYLVGTGSAAVFLS